jgi:hypothetical protein
MGLAVTMTPSGSSALVQCTSGTVGIPPKLLGLLIYCLHTIVTGGNSSFQCVILYLPRPSCLYASEINIDCWSILEYTDEKQISKVGL